MRDPKAMRAMAHPVRLQVMEILNERGALTATELGELIGESPANTSFHLRTLAKYGFVEEADGGTGRSRPWRPVSGGMLVREDELTGDARRAATAMVGALRGAVFRRIERWAGERAGYSEPWQRAGFEIEFTGTLSPAELAEVGAKINAALAPYKRSSKDAPPDAARITVAAWGFPTDSAALESS
jgi:DNA-binding transcriptional ArsR family regulator